MTLMGARTGPTRGRSTRRWLLAGVSALLLLALAGGGETFGATSDRSLVPASRLTDRPYRSLVLVSVGNSVVCTGFVVAPRKVVTAAHCLVRNAARGNFRFRTDLPGSIRLYRAYSGIHGGSPYRSCGVSRAWAHSRFIKRDKSDRLFGSRAHDYAVLTTDPDCAYPSNAVMRLWATTKSSGKLTIGQVVRYGGYPADARFEDMNGLNLWRTRGKLKSSVDQRLLSATGFVARGMSGSPVWRSFGKDSPCGQAQCVVGILTECSVNSSGECRLGEQATRRAVRVTPRVRKTIRRR